MKSPERHEVAAKPVDTATDQASFPNDASEGENQRRRVIRGVVACAPLVLTLRSGALAAASCTAAKVVAITTDDKGKFTPPPGSGVAEGDFCVSNVQACVQGEPSRIGGGTIDPVPISRASNGNGSKLQCGVSGQRTVAILSSGSATSLTG